MKIWKLALAVLLAAGTVAAYVYFPNPIEQVSRRESAVPAGGTPSAETPPDDHAAGVAESN